MRKNLSEKPEFSWVEDCLESHAEIKANILCMHVRAVKKFQFGVEIPGNPKHVFALDKLNDDNLQKQSFNKELAEINMHETFHEPLPGEDISECKKVKQESVLKQGEIIAEKETNKDPQTQNEMVHRIWDPGGQAEQPEEPTDLRNSN